MGVCENECGYVCLVYALVFCINTWFRRNWKYVALQNLGVVFILALITCQNFQFWQVCSSDGLFVGLCVCLSVSYSIKVTVFDIY